MSIKYVSYMFLTVILLSSLFVPTHANIFNIQYNQAAPIAAEIPKVILQQGTAGTSAIYTNNTSAKVSAAAPKNWLIGWEKRLKITIDNSDVDSELANFPVMIYLSNSSGRNNADVSFIFDELASYANRKKIAVTISDGIIQTFVEIERWDHAGAQAWLWTKVPSISNTTETVLYFYYDKNQADNSYYVGDPNSTAAENVWDSNFLAVQHMEEDPSGSISDSTSLNNDMISAGGMTSSNLVEAKIGKGVYFDGINDHYDSSPNQATLQKFTFEAWIWIGANNDNWRTIVSVGGGFGTEFRDFCTVNRILALDDTAPNYFGTAIPTGTWRYVVSTYDGSINRGYIESIQQSQSYSENWVSFSYTFTIGEWGGNYDYFNGILDEIRISNVNRSTAWIKASYESGRDDFLDFGSEELSSYYPNNYNVASGAYLSGTVPSSVKTVDSNYFNVKSVGTSAIYNPLGYSLLGSSAYVSGSISNLASNDNNYMNFRSYVTATSATSKTDAFVAYRSNTGSLLNFPKFRFWDGETASLGSENEMANAGSPVRYIRTAVSPKSERAMEKIVATLSDDGYLDAYVFDGTSWTVTNNIGQVWTTPPADARRPFDIVYESVSGEAILVYGSTVAGGTNDLAYRVWSFQSGWSSEQYYDDTGHAAKITVTYVVLASDPNSDRIGLVYIDSANNHANAVIWGGSSWSNSIELTGAIGITTEECIAIASESVSGAFMAVAGEGQFIKWSRFTTSWSNVGIFDINSGATSAMNWLKLSNSQGNRIMLTSVDAASDLCTALWDEKSLGNRQWSTATETMGSMTATSSVSALRFTAQNSKSVTNILVYIQAVAASPAYRFGIETSTASYLPSGTYVGGTSNYAVSTPTVTGWINVALPSSASLTAGTVYHITVRYDSGTIGASNYIALRRMGAVPNNFRPKENQIDPWLNTIFGTTIQGRDPIFALSFTDLTYESMPYDTSPSSHNIFGANWFSEKWTQGTNQIISGVNIPLAKAGTPLGSLLIVLRDETGSQDVATITVPQSEITTTLQWYEKYFTSPLTLQSGRVYRLILRSPSSTTSSNSFSCRSLSTSQSGDFTYDGTNSLYSSSTNSGSTWTDTTTRDLVYVLLSDAGTSGWVIHPPWDTDVDTNAQRCADFAWEHRATPAFQNQGLLVYGTSAGQITWRRFRAPNYMTAATNAAMGASIHPWVQLKSNTRDITGDVKILGAVLEGTAFDLGTILWDGTTFTILGTTTITSDTTVITYECFQIGYNWFGDPTEFTSEVEITGTSNTQTWRELVWTIDSSFTSAGIAATFQLYNYNASLYPTSGDGYISDSMGTSDTTKTQTITTNPMHFRDEAGNWKIKVKSVKNTATQFDFRADWVEYKPTYTYGQYTVSTEFMFSNMTTNMPTELNFTVVSEYDVSNVSVTIQVWNYSSSAYVTSGEGYLTYMSSGSNEAKLVNISVNPEFHISNGNAKIKITGVLTTTMQFQQKVNQVKLFLNYASSSDYNYVLKIVNQASDPWKIRLRTYSQSNINRLNNCTLYFRNSSDGISRQIYIENGVYVNQTGSWYDLPALPAEIYIALSLQAINSEVSYVYVYLEVLVPNTSTSNFMIVTFEIS